MSTYPGDTFAMDTAVVIRTSTMIKPVMDNMYLDIYYFSVPNRLVWEHWKEFMGENTLGPWEQETEYTIPQITAPAGGWVQGTIADYMFFPTKVSGISVSSLFFRAYSLIWNEFFRDENLQSPTDVPLTDATETGVNTGTYETDPCKGGLPLPVNKYHDYFTSALVDQMKGPDVSIPLGTSAPIANDESHNFMLTPMLRNSDGSHLLGYGSLGYNTSATGTFLKANENGTVGNKSVYMSLKADLSNASAAKITDLVTAIKTQQLYMIDARSGTRYTEVIQGHFGVISPDARLQRPEYLGGKRIPINVDQVVQTSSTDTTSPQANVSAYSLTADKDESFTKSFTEHGMIIGLACVRTDHTYQQGIDRMYSRKRRLDFYFPILAGMPEQEILAKEIYAQGTPADDTVFGYQERWSEYKFKSNHVTGQMRSNAQGSLDLYHYADNYASLPTLGDEWIQETSANIDRTLAVKSTGENPVDQFQADFYFNLDCARPMPVHCVMNMNSYF